MSGRTVQQEYLTDRLGRRRPTHTPRFRDCRCNGCCQRRWWTTARRRARSEKVRAEYAAGTRRKENGARNHPACWSPDEDRLLRELAADHDCLTIGRLLGERIHKPRSESAVKHRCKTLGIARMEIRPLSSSEVGRLFGMSRETVRTRFVNRGAAHGAASTGRPARHADL